VNALGDNPGWIVPISKSDSRTALVKYGRTELYFEENQKLWGVQITSSRQAPKRALAMDYQELKKSLSYNRTKIFLSKNNIGFEEKASEYDKNDRVIKTQGQVIFYFDNNGRIDKFGRFLTAAECSLSRSEF